LKSSTIKNICFYHGQDRTFLETIFYSRTFATASAVLQ